MRALRRLRRSCRVVKVGDLLIGGGNPVVVQEMTSTRTDMIGDTVAQIRELMEAGCRLVRVAVPDEPSADAIRSFKETGAAIVADVHYDHRLALRAIEAGADKLRLNPGTMGKRAVAVILDAAEERGIPIRIGVNGGSVRREYLDRYGGVTPEALVESALDEVSLLEKHGFFNTVLSIKSSDADLTVRANRVLADRVDYPLHVGVTESGYGEQGRIRSIMGVGGLLLDGIGDTVRISLANRDRRENVRVCRDVLESLNIPWS
jgi:(E)-4-hydroxy-3-methylbut-2-enyl-diphosphate synthase